MKTRSIVLGSFAALSLSGAVFGDFLIFTDPGQFFQALEDQGKVSKGFWDFKPNNVGAGFIGGFDDPLNFQNIPVQKNGVPFWDSMPLDNVQFQSNLNPFGQGGPNPRGVNGLAFATAPFFGIKNNILVANTFVDSYDILSGVPVGDNHTAMALNVVSLASGGGDVVVTVWDKNEEHKTSISLQGPWQDNEKRFVGILAVDARTIGRVNIYDTTGGNTGAEGISAIEVWLAGDDNCPWDLDGNGSVGATDLLALLVNWGPYEPCPPYKPMDFDQNCTVSATDLLALLVNWGDCPCKKDRTIDIPTCDSPPIKQLGNTTGAGNDSALRDSEDLIFGINIGQAGIYSFDMTTNVEDPCLWDSYMYLIDSTGDPCEGTGIIAFNDDCPGAGCFGLSCINDVSLEPGEYWIVIEGFAAGDSGPVDLHITSSCPVECTKDVEVVIGACDEPPFKVLGTTVGAGNDSACRDSDDFIIGFNIVETGNYTFDMTTNVNPCQWDSYMYLTAGDPCTCTGVIAFNDDCPGIGCFGLSCIGPIRLEPGEYWIVVEGFSAADSGPVDLHVTSECQQPPKECKGQTCETYTFDCDPADPSCVCYTSPNGAFCGPGVPCEGAIPCGDDGDCPPGFRCAILTCCGDEGICIPLCETGLGAEIPAGVRTSTGG